MRKIDFLSISPQTFIFQKSSNKTTFGGFLTLIYILIILIMAIVYYIIYDINDKYIISYSLYKKEIDYSNLNDPRYNPTLKFSFDVLDYSRKPLSDNFVLLNYNTFQLIKRDEIIEQDVYNTRIIVLYNCADMKCDIREEDLKGSSSFEPVFYFNFRHSYYDFNLQDDDEPIKLNEKLTNYIEGFNPEIGQCFDYFWQPGKVIDEQGILDKFIGYKKESVGGSFSHSSLSTIKTSIYNADYFTVNGKKLNFKGIFKVVYIFNCVNQYDEYIEYKRKKISVFDLICNICSLALTIFNLFKLGFSILYSSSFDNYKIIDRILSTRDISIEKFSKKNKDTKPPLLTELKEIDEEIEKENNEKEDKLIEAKKVKENKDSILPRYHFFDFICNIFSCCFKNNKTQKCISACNEITGKYYSIENILYNQFMIENLLKDYKWNNPDLKFIKNIQLIDKLNYIIDDNQT
jgi:hypothetical protein